MYTILLSTFNEIIFSLNLILNYISVRYGFVLSIGLKFKTLLGFCLVMMAFLVKCHRHWLNWEDSMGKSYQEPASQVWPSQLQVCGVTVKHYISKQKYPVQNNCEENMLFQFMVQTFDHTVCNMGLNKYFSPKMLVYPGTLNSYI